MTFRRDVTGMILRKGNHPHLARLLLLNINIFVMALWMTISKSYDREVKWVSVYQCI